MLTTQMLTVLFIFALLVTILLFILKRFRSALMMLVYALILGFASYVGIDEFIDLLSKIPVY